jgi:hypothetical protein
VLSTGCAEDEVCDKMFRILEEVERKTYSDFYIKNIRRKLWSFDQHKFGMSREDRTGLFKRMRAVLKPGG